MGVDSTAIANAKEFLEVCRTVVRNDLNVATLDWFWAIALSRLIFGFSTWVKWF